MWYSHHAADVLPDVTMRKEDETMKRKNILILLVLVLLVVL